MIAQANRPRPIALIILDGWGYREEKEANAIAAAHTPNWNFLWQHCPHTLISGCGHDVGLPEGQMGNSEVGHLTMGAGRIIYQDLTRIDEAIATGEFFKNPILLDAIAQAKQKRKALHVLGLLSPGGVHSHEQHTYALLELCAKQQLDSVYLHPFLDGRDTPPRSALSSLQALEEKIQQLHCGKIVSIIGRYFAMDRDKRWERIQKTYDLLTSGIAPFHAKNAVEGLELAYARGETDEFVQATTIHDVNQLPVTIEPGDVIVFMNFRSDRAREITQAMIDPDFTGFKRSRWPKLSVFVSLTEYDKRFPVAVAFPPQVHKNILAEYLSNLGLQQLRIAETEKYAHVTFFFNGGIETPFPGEHRLLIPSPKVATYDQKPEMSAFEITEKLVHEIENQRYDLIICNFANPDMVGHTGNFAATVKAIEVIDQCLGKIHQALQKVGGEMLITSDHGNAELMFDPSTNQAHTAHTSEKSPFIYSDRKAEITQNEGSLSDIAPTILYLMGIPQPAEMTGKTLINLE